jgi:hypothetical protein
MTSRHHQTELKLQTLRQQMVKWRVSELTPGRMQQMRCPTAWQKGGGVTPSDVQLPLGLVYGFPQQPCHCCATGMVCREQHMCISKLHKPG